MKNVGRVLILPKGEFDESVTYEILDLIYYQGDSWLCKKTVVGIAPADGSEYWQRVTGSMSAVKRTVVEHGGLTWTVVSLQKSGFQIIGATANIEACSVESLKSDYYVSEVLDTAFAYPTAFVVAPSISVTYTPTYFSGLVSAVCSETGTGDNAPKLRLYAHESLVTDGVLNVIAVGMIE